MKVKQWFHKFLAGIGIGVGAAIPGVSGAAIAVIFKVYESIIWSVNNFFKKFGRAIAILIPVLLGIVVAVIPCIYLFDKALECLVFATICLFAGFLIGSCPSVLDEVKDIKPSKKQTVFSILSAVFVVVLGALSIIIGKYVDLNALFNEMPVWLYFVLIPVGFVAAVALTVPGLSGSLILLVIGFYKPLLSHTVGWAKEIIVEGSWANFPKLIGMLGCFAVGVLLGVIVVSKVMKVLLAKHHDTTYFVIIGFILGSIIALFLNYNIFNYYLVWAGQEIEGITPALPIYIEIPLGIILVVGAIFLSYLLVKANRKTVKNLEE